MVVVGMVLCIIGLVAYTLGMMLRYDASMRDERSTVGRICLAAAAFGAGTWLAGTPYGLGALFTGMLLATVAVMERLRGSDIRRADRAKAAREASGDAYIVPMSSKRPEPVSDEQLKSLIGDVDWGLGTWWDTRGGRR